MSFDYKIDTELETVYIRLLNDVKGKEVLTMASKVFTNRKWTNGYSILLDYRYATNIDITKEDIRRIADQDIKNKMVFDRSKCAIVVASDLGYGLSRMWKILSEESQIESDIFRNIEDAFRWLELEEHVFDSIQDLTLHDS